MATFNFSKTIWGHGLLQLTASLVSMRVCLAVSKFASCTHAEDKNWAKSSMEVEVQVGVVLRPPGSTPAAG